jgi:NAD(P)-dependent dehydrogenase (short-subunit alcohol dehydrogenase family)
LKTILITGASSGIGFAASISLARKGYSVYAGVRKESDARTLSEQSSLITPVMLDVTRERDIQAVFQKIDGEFKRAQEFCLVNNAGVALASPMECVPLGELRRQFDVNYFGVLAVTQAFLPLIRQTQGRIVNISSISGRLTLPFLGPYSSSKFALEAMTDALRRELKNSGVKVMSINPGSVRTPIWNKGDAWKKASESQSSPDRMEVYAQSLKIFHERVKESAENAPEPHETVKTICRALDSQNPKTRYFVGRKTKFKAFLARHLPDKAMDYFIGKIFTKKP